MAISAALLLLLSLLMLAPRPLEAGLEVIDLRKQSEAGGASGRQLLATNECASKGMGGTCNGCVCCCFDGGAGIVNYEPTDSCTCTRKVNSTQIWATVVLSAVLILASLLVQLYFGGSFRLSPYPSQQQRQAAARSRRQRSGRVSPEDQQQQQQQASMAAQQAAAAQQQMALRQQWQPAQPAHPPPAVLATL